MARNSGKGGSATVNSVSLYITDWSVDETAVLPDATDSGTPSGEMSFVSGRVTRTINVKGWCDDTYASTYQPIMLKAGTQVTTIHLTLAGSSKYVIPKALVESCRVDVPVGSGGTISFEAVLKQNVLAGGDVTTYPT